MRLRRWLLGIVAVVASTAAIAQDCYEWRQNSGLAWEKTPGGAMNTYCQSLVPNGSPTQNGQWDYQCTNLRLASGGFPAYAFDRTNKVTSSCQLNPPSSCVVTQGGTTVLTLANQKKGDGCPQCPPAGETKFQDGSGPLSNAPAKLCIANCSFKKGGVGLYSPATNSWAQTYVSEGQACATNAGTTGAADGDDDDCDATGLICKDDGPSPNKNCGVYNGDRVCVGSVPPNGCVAYGSGGVACKGPQGGGSPSSPPAPSTGGTPAPPDVQVTAEDGTTINYYGGATVAGAGTAPTTGSAVPEGGNRPIGAGGSGGGDGDGEGGEDEPCVTSECDASVPELEDIGTVSDAMGAFWSNLQAVPIVSAAASIGASFGAGACPDWSTSISVFGHSWVVDFGGICTTWADVAGVLSAVMLVFWGFIAFRILFSA